MQGGSPAAGQATWSPTFPSRIPAPQQPTPPTCCAEQETRHAAVSPRVPSAPAAGTPSPSAPSHPGRVLSLRTAPTRVPSHPAPAAPPQPLSTPARAFSPCLPACLQRRPELTPVPAVPRYRLHDSKHSSTRFTAGDCGAGRRAGLTARRERPLGAPGPARAQAGQPPAEPEIAHCGRRDFSTAERAMGDPEGEVTSRTALLS